MGISAERFIEQTGGFRLGESPQEFQRRQRTIKTLEKKLIAGKITHAERNALYQLKGLPPDEFDYTAKD